MLDKYLKQWLCSQQAEFESAIESKWTNKMQEMVSSHENALALKAQDLSAEASAHAAYHKELDEARVLLLAKVVFKNLTFHLHFT